MKAFLAALVLALTFNTVALSAEVFKVVAVLMTPDRELHVLTSLVEFPTQEACDTARTGNVTEPASIEKLVSDLKAQGVDALVQDSKCLAGSDIEKLQESMQLR